MTNRSPIGLFVEWLIRFASALVRLRLYEKSVTYLNTNRPRFTAPGLPCWSPIQLLTEKDGERASVAAVNLTVTDARSLKIATIQCRLARLFCFTLFSRHSM